LALFDAAEKYLRGVLQERFDPKIRPPITMWKNQLAEKISESKALTREYNTLKDETYKIEQIRASVKTILHNDTPQPERTPQKSRGAEI